jgi:hypothetical protein
MDSAVHPEDGADDVQRRVGTLSELHRLLLHSIQLALGALLENLAHHG